MFTVFDAYFSLKSAGIVKTQAAYSTRWLRKSPSYLSAMRAMNCPAGLDAQLNLFSSLQRAAQNCESRGLHEDVRLAGYFRGLADKVWEGLRR